MRAVGESIGVSGTSAYAELQVTRNFSFLRGASHPEELVAVAADLGLAAMALSDRNTLAGVVRAHIAARRAGLRFIVGAVSISKAARGSCAFPPIVTLTAGCRGF